jgi:hypothetical protein
MESWRIQRVRLAEESMEACADESTFSHLCCDCGGGAAGDWAKQQI